MNTGRALPSAREVRVLTRDEVSQVLSMDRAIDLVESAVKAHSGGLTEVPLRTHLTVPTPPGG